jgi:hypothetical protein
MPRGLEPASARYLLLALLVPFAGCGDGGTGPAEVTIDLTIRGRVISEPGGDAIVGATVDYGWGGHFSLPQVLGSDVTDASGAYEIRHSLTYSDPCPFQWMQASAPGFRGLRNIEDQRVGVRCVESVQVIDIPLEPSD